MLAFQPEDINDGDMILMKMDFLENRNDEKVIEQTIQIDYVRFGKSKINQEIKDPSNISF